MANDGDRQFEALEAAISVDHMGTYLGEVNDDRALARELYVWDRGLDRGDGLGRCGMIVRRKASTDGASGPRHPWSEPTENFKKVIDEFGKK